MRHEANRIREQMAADPHRPLYHFLPPRYWMNDPNGCIQWRGQYHLFYQHNPAAAHWGDIHWGHAASADLVHWQDLPVALAPTPGSPDADGCWSGTACDDNGVPTLVYTARLGQGESVCLATSDDGLRTWRKSAQNPVISGPPPGLDPLGFRDPYVWREAGDWRMALGSGTRASGGCVLLYYSPDLRTWTYLRRLAEAGSPDPDDMWECPSFLPLGGNPRAPDALAPSGAQGCGLKGKHVLVVSAMGQWRAIYFVGRYQENRFIPEREGVMDWGGRYYAPQVMADQAGRRLMFGWIREGRTLDSQIAAGWAGVQALPRVLSLAPDGALRMSPAPELEALRGACFKAEDMALRAGDDVLLPLEGECLEIEAELAEVSASCSLKLRCSPREDEVTVLSYDALNQQLSVDTTRASLATDVERGVTIAPLELAPGEQLRLHIFLDRSVLEVFANDRVCLTSRIYPSRPDSRRVQVTAAGGPARLRMLTAWRMNSIWPDQHTA